MRWKIILLLVGCMVAPAAAVDKSVRDSARTFVKAYMAGDVKGITDISLPIPKDILAKIELAMSEGRAEQALVREIFKAFPKEAANEYPEPSPDDLLAEAMKDIQTSKLSFEGAIATLLVDHIEPLHFQREGGAWKLDFVAWFHTRAHYELPDWEETVRANTKAYQVIAENLRKGRYKSVAEVMKAMSHDTKPENMVPYEK